LLCAQDDLCVPLLLSVRLQVNRRRSTWLSVELDLVVLLPLARCFLVPGSYSTVALQRALQLGPDRVQEVIDLLLAYEQNRGRPALESLLNARYGWTLAAASKLGFISSATSATVATTGAPRSLDGVALPGPAPPPPTTEVGRCCAGSFALRPRLPGCAACGPP
jgi:hypothetical protein